MNNRRSKRQLNSDRVSFSALLLGCGKGCSLTNHHTIPIPPLPAASPATVPNPLMSLQSSAVAGTTNIERTGERGTGVRASSQHDCACASNGMEWKQDDSHAAHVHLSNATRKQTVPSLKKVPSYSGTPGRWYLSRCPRLTVDAITH
jgi:hypothetical protein